MKYLVIMNKTEALWVGFTLLLPTVVSSVEMSFLWSKGAVYLHIFLSTFTSLVLIERGHLHGLHQVNKNPWELLEKGLSLVSIICGIEHW